MELAALAEVASAPGAAIPILGEDAGERGLTHDKVQPLAVQSGSGAGPGPVSESLWSPVAEKERPTPVEVLALCPAAATGAHFVPSCPPSQDS